MQRVFVVLALPWLVLGCATSSNDPVEARARAVRCAESWRARGFDFDPNAMTCTQMYERVQAIRNAAYWQERGYLFDPEAMTVKEMDLQAAELQEAGIREYRDPALGDSPDSRGASSQPASPTASEPARAEAGATTAAPAGESESAASTPTPEPTAGTGATKTTSARPSAAEDIKAALAGMTLKDVRRKYPQYNDMDDLDLARRIHATYFSDTPFDEFARAFFPDER